MRLRGQRGQKSGSDSAPLVHKVDAQTANDETLLAIHAVEEACAPERGESSRTPADALAFMRNPPAGEGRDYWLAWLDDEPAGRAMLTTHPGRPVGWLRLGVAPQHRRRGAGRALLDAVRADAHVEKLSGHHVGEAGRAFADAVGARGEHCDIRSALRLREAPLPDLVVPRGYVLRSWTGASPDDVVESFAAARNAVYDAPNPGDDPEPQWTVERLRAIEQAVLRRGRELRVTVALAADGRVASFTEHRVSPPPSPSASTEDTATVAEHRGRGLAGAVKVEALRRLREERPDVEVVDTLNAGANAAMLAVNGKLGFVPVATLTIVTLRLRS